MPNFELKTFNTVSNRPNAAKTSLGSKKVQKRPTVAKTSPGSKKVQKPSSDKQRLTATLNQLTPAIRIILHALADGPLDSITLQIRVKARTGSPVEDIPLAMVSAGVLDIYTGLQDIHPVPVLVFKLV